MKKRFVYFLLIAAQLCMTGSLFAQSDFEKIIQNVVAEKKVGITAATTSINSGTTTLMNNMASDGSFTDITYGAAPAGDVPYNTHVSRLRQMALAYTFSGASHYNSVALYNKIVSGLQFWNSKNYVAGNWYYNQIGYPQLLGEFLILMRGSSGTLQLPAADESPAIGYLTTRDDPAGQTGANRVDEALHWIYRGALTENAAAISHAVTNIQSTMVPVASGAEGINPDNAFLQHNAQIMTQGYGADYLNSVYDAGVYLVGTTYSFTQAQLDVVYRFTHHAFYAAARGRYKDFSLDGRGISRENNGTLNANIARKAKVADPLHASEFTDDSLRVTGVQPPNYKVATPYHIHYWTGDYTLHNRPGYSFSVRSNSTRTVRTETMNGENLLGTWLSDGATSIRVQGSEYYNLFPVWDWNMVPGITMRQFATPQTNTNGVNSYGITAFVGGVSDSSYGASVYRQNNGGVTASKAWFFFDNEVVCLGAGITSSQPEHIATSINQAALNGSVTIKSSGATAELTGNTQQNFTGNALNWIFHDQVGYYFPAGGNITVSNQSQSGSWRTIRTAGSSTPITANVFKLWMNHGAAPANATYAYVVVPGMASAAQMETYDQGNIQILSNNASVQGVKHQGLNMIALVFSAAGTLNIPGAELTAVTVDKPCVLLIKKTNTTAVEVHISDPSQQYGTINMTLNFAIAPAKTIACTMPTGNQKGASLKVDMNATAAPVTPSTVLAVLRIGGVNGANGLSGKSNLASGGTPVHIDKYKVENGTFTYLSSIDLNAGAAGDKIFMSNSNNEGYLTLSENRQYLSFMGYASKPASGNIYDVNTNPSIPRTLGLLKFDGTINLSTALANFPASGTSATAQTSITNDGSNLWAVTNGGNGIGVLYTQPGATNAAEPPTVFVANNVISNRSLGIFGNDLYYTGASGTRVGTVSASGGLPVTGGNTMTALPLASGSTAFTSFTPSQMVMFDMDLSVPGMDVLYLTNAGTATGQSGIYKYCKQANGQWVSYGTFGAAAAPEGMYFGITGEIVNGLPVLYVTRGNTNAAAGNVAANQVLQIQEQAGYNATMNGSILALINATASGMEGSLRGIAFYPAVSYYYKGSGNINETASWATNTDGTGAEPADFSTDNQTFFITKNSNATFSGDLVISGSGAKLVVGNGLEPVSVTIPQGYAINAETDVYHNAALVLQNTALPSLRYLTASSTVSYAATNGQTVLNMAYGNFSNPAGSTSTINGEINVTGKVLQSGLLKGNGSIVTATGLTNNGTLSPGNSAGLMTVKGAFTNAPNGTLKIELGGASTPGTDYDQLVVTGNATLGGTLELKLIDGFTPVAGQSFTVLSANAVSGTFQTVVWPAGANGSVSYTGNAVTVSFMQALPLKLLDFTASLLQNGHVQLTWETAGEENLRHFEVEKISPDQSLFSTLLEMKAAGTGNHRYAAIDPHPVAGLQLYRLKMVDNDGRYTYSKTAGISVMGNRTKNLVVYPNPVAHTLTLSHAVASPAASLQIHFADGKTVLTKTLPQGSVQSSVDVSALNPGWYVVTVTNGKEKESASFIKK